MTSNFRHTFQTIDDKFYTIPVVDAMKCVYFELKPEDVQNGVPNQSGSCAYAWSIRRQRKKFPNHLAYLIEVTRSKAYIVTKVNKSGEPLECVVYTHNVRENVKLFDTGGKQVILDSFVDGEKQVFALMPRARKVGEPGKARRVRVSKPRGIGGSKGSTARGSLAV